jgi:dihydrofolate reductase
MPKLIYSMLTSLDGYIEDSQGNFDWAMPDAEVFAYCNELGSTIGVHLYGRRMYEMMVYWETSHTLPDQGPAELTWARQWQAAEKIVYSRTLAEPKSARTTIQREFNADYLQRLKGSATSDLCISGPELAAYAIQAGLVDEFQAIIFPVIVGGGKKFLPDGVRLNLALLDQRCFRSGVTALCYSARN